MAKLLRLCETVSNWDSLENYGYQNQLGLDSVKDHKKEVVVHDLAFLYQAKM